MSDDPHQYIVVHVSGGDWPQWRVLRSDGMQLVEEVWPCEFTITDDFEPDRRPYGFFTQAEAERFVTLYRSGVPLGLIPVAPASTGTTALKWAALE